MASFRNVEIVEEEYDEGQDEFEAAVANILARCKSAKIDVRTVNDSFMYDAEYYVLMPQGKGQREVNLWTAEGAKRFEAVRFEDYRFIAGYIATYSLTDDAVECAVRPLNSRGFANVRRHIFRGANEDGSEVSRLISFQTSEGPQQIELGPMTKEFRAINPGSTGQDSISLRLLGYGVKNHDDALRTLERVANSIFMQIDLIIGVGFALSRDRQYRFGKNHTNDTLNLLKGMPFPKHEFDNEPVSLYQYGRSADGMPLLQFLAFYQVAEFYYPIYSNADARRRVRNVLKDPNFRESREIDIGRLLSIMQTKSGQFGSERAQLKATINECVDAQGLLIFIKEDARRLAFFKSQDRKSRHAKITIEGAASEVLTELANRLYDIRCEIVHTKSNEDEDAAHPRLLPFSPEADQLEHDIALMRFVAQRVLIAASRAL